MTQQLRRAYEANRNAIRFLKKEMLALEIPEKGIKNRGIEHLTQQKIVERKKVNG